MTLRTSHEVEPGIKPSAFGRSITRSCTFALLCSWWCPEEFEGRDPDGIREAFHGSQREVPLAGFDAPEIGAVYIEYLSELFLGQSATFAVATDVLTDGALELALHLGNAVGLLLVSLHTYK